VTLWLVISSFRNDDDVMRILHQVHACHEQIVDRILIVDSEGTGCIPGLLEKNGWDHVMYRSYDKNLGSGANLCERLRLAAAGGADYAYAINHDGSFDAKVLRSLVNAASAIENLGVAYPLGYLTTVDLYNVTGTRELPWPAKLVAAAPKGPLLDVFWSSSNGALYSMDPVKRDIVPWEALWMGWEDLEYGWRLSDHGYRQVIVCEAVFRDNYEYRRTRLSRVRTKPAWRTYYNIRNLILAIRHSRNSPLFYAVAAYRFLLECGLILFVRENKWKRLRLLCAGASDGLRGVGGQQQSLDHSIA
jgi:GT2 family glycosyltransferase